MFNNDLKSAYLLIFLKLKVYMHLYAPPVQAKNLSSPWVFSYPLTFISKPGET